MNMSGFDAKVKALLASLPLSAEAGLRAALKKPAANLVHDIDRDTNRLVRGYIQAFADTNLMPRAMPAIQDSRDSERRVRQLVGTVARLEKERQRWQRWKQHYDTNKRTKQRYYRTILRKLAKADKQLALAEADLKSFQADRSLLVIRNKKRLREFTVRRKIYGGRGAVIRSAAGAAFVWTIMEPHAIIRDRITRRTRRMLAQTKAAGAALAKPAMLRVMRRAAGMR